MYQFFTEPSNIHDKSVIIEGSDVNHIKNVLRIKPGEEISVSNGIDGREYRCEVVESSASFDSLRKTMLSFPIRYTFFRVIPRAIRWNS